MVHGINMLYVWGVEYLRDSAPCVRFAVRVCALISNEWYLSARCYATLTRDNSAPHSYTHTHIHYALHSGKNSKDDKKSKKQLEEEQRLAQEKDDEMRARRGLCVCMCVGCVYMSVCVCI